MPPPITAPRRPPHKGTFTPQICPPSPELWGRVERAAKVGDLPVYRAAGGLRVPALHRTRERHAYLRDATACGIRPAVAAHLDAEREGAERVGNSQQARVQLARLSAAAYRDLAGNSLADIAEHAGYGGEEESRLRTVRRDIATGRRLWAAIGAWPWWPIRDALGEGALVGGLPETWWEVARVVETLWTWQTLAPDGSVRR